MSPADLALRMLGDSVVVQGLPAEAAQVARRLWRAMALPPAEYATAADISIADLLLAEPASQGWPQLLGLLAVHLNRLALDRFSGFAVHSGVVALNGRVVALPASSGSGKTTMTAAACATGWAYVSDEALCVDYETEDVVGYPRPLAMSRWSASALGLQERGLDTGDELLVAPDDVAGQVTSSPGRLTDVVILDRGNHPEPARLSAMPRSEIVPLLLRRSFNHYRNPERALRLAATLAAESRCWRLQYGDPTGGAAALCALAQL